MEAATKSDYDLHSAVTFFLVGVGVGSVLALVFNPKHRVVLQGINRWRRAVDAPFGPVGLVHGGHYEKSTPKSDVGIAFGFRDLSARPSVRRKRGDGRNSI